MKSEFYVTRDTYSDAIEVIPAHIGIRKCEGCVIYAPAGRWRLGESMRLHPADCKYIFGFVPKEGEAWLIEGNKKTKVDIEFTK